MGVEHYCKVIHKRKAFRSDDGHDTSDHHRLVNPTVPAPTNSTLNMSNICEAAASYALVARVHGEYMWKQRAEVLITRAAAC